MSVASRVRALPLLRSSLLARSSGSACCGYSSVAAARAVPRRTASCRPSSASVSRDIDAAAVRTWRAGGARWNSTESSSSAGSDDGGSVASSQTSLGSEAEAQPSRPGFSFAFE